MTNRTTIDARNAFCPGPMMEMIAAMKQVSIGDEIEVLSSDKGSANDIPVWTKKVGHELVSTENLGSHWSIVVKRMK